MSKKHNFKASLEWKGNLGTGTDSYTTYSRDFNIVGDKNHIIEGSSDPIFNGNGKKYNPEELLIQALSSCHMLWYLHLCADAGVIVEKYADDADGDMEIVEGGKGKFTLVTLRPNVIVKDSSMIIKALELHDKAHEHCFIASSVNFDVACEPNVMVDLG